jgi:IS30 family transposase
MPKALTPEERQQIIDLLPTGASCRQIAKQVGRSYTTVSAIARDVGHEFGRLQSTRATEINQAYTSERRAQLRLKTLANIERLTEEMFSPTVAFNFGGRDNSYNEHRIPQPTYKDIRDIAQAIAAQYRVIEAIDKQDHTDTDGSFIDQMIKQAKAEGESYASDFQA